MNKSIRIDIDADIYAKAATIAQANGIDLDTLLAGFVNMLQTAAGERTLRELLEKMGKSASDA
jgi:antitoxin component of RelBE/YafQ-DinJ toxin-antitoxin module